MCEVCGDPKKSCELIGIYDQSFIAMMPFDVLCPMCDGYAMLNMQGWESAKPCPICKGVGQLNERDVPDMNTMVLKVLKITPPKDQEAVFKALTQQ